MGLKEYLFGKKSEDLAANYLLNLGYVIVERNFSSKFGEIDIVAKKAEVYHFVEVKATMSEYEIEYRIDAQKMEKLLKTIQIYLSKHSIDAPYQLDGLFVKDDKFKLIENITL